MMVEYDFSAIQSAVVKMLKVNMGLKEGEKVLFLCDVPTMEDWYAEDEAYVQDFAIRTMMVRAAHRIAKEAFPQNEVELYLYPSCGGHGVEPKADVGEEMLKYNVIIIINSWSLSHTTARLSACKKGARIASCANLELGMLLPDGVIDADYYRIAEKAQHIADLITEARDVRIVTPEGTDLRFSVADRPGQCDGGFYTQPGSWGNLPGGEAYAVPLEGTAEGTLVVPARWAYRLDEAMTFVIREGLIQEVKGGGQVGAELRQFLSSSGSPQSRRNVAELGIGTNYRASKPDNVLECEKIDGTIHIGFGDNSHMGGLVESDYHDDMVMPHPDLYLDGKLVMEQGRLLV